MAGYIRLFCPSVLATAGRVACSTATQAPTQTTPGIGVDITSTNRPSSVVKAGDQFTRTNQDRSEYVVQAEPGDGSVLFDSGILQPDDTFAFVFTEAGTYTYRGSAENAMNGTITVERYMLSPAITVTAEMFSISGSQHATRRRNKNAG